MKAIPTRDKILSAARSEFAAYGMEGARVDRIARRARVNKAMIYYHFNSKKALYQHVLDDIAQNVFGRLYEELPPDPDLETVLRLVARNYRKLLTDRETILPIILREIADSGSALQSTFTRIIGETGLRTLLGNVIKRERRARNIRRIDVRHALASFLGMNIWYFVIAPIFNAVWEIEDEDAFIAQREKAVVDLFLNGIRSK
jgi:TetR/AcrR family transcriptional regulator